MKTIITFKQHTKYLSITAEGDFIIEKYIETKFCNCSSDVFKTQSNTYDEAF